MYIGLLIFNIITGIGGDYYQFAFTIILALIGFNLIYKGIVIKSSSTMWFANNLILMAIALMVMSLLKLDMTNYIFVFASVSIIPSIINLIVFNNLIYLRLIIINIFVLIPLIIQYFMNFEVSWFVGLMVVSLVIGMVVCRLMNFGKEKI